MEKLDLQYICSVIGNLMGIPVRLFENGEQVFYQSFVNLPKDPFVLYKKEIFDITANLGYYITPIFNYYGIVNYAEQKIVIGPTRRLRANEKDLRELAFRLDLMQEVADEFVRAMQSIITMPLESVMQMLCVVNYVINGEKLKLEDIQIYDIDQNELRQSIENERTEKNFDTPTEIQT